MIQDVKIKRLCCAFLLLFFVICARPSNTNAQAVGAHRGDSASAGGRRSIKGKLFLPNGRPDATTRFKVRLENVDIGFASTVTDSDGEFTFNGVGAGSYDIVIEETPEFEGARENIYIDPTAGGPVVIIPFYMRLKPSADPALQGVPKNALDPYLKGVEAARKGDSKKAVESFKVAVANYHPFLAAYTHMGIQYLKLGNLEDASSALTAALKLDPEDFEANLNYGIVLLQQKKFDEAETPLRVAIKHRETAATPHLYLGIALTSLKRLPEAQKELETTVGLAGGANMAQAHRYLGGIYWGNREYKKAADELETYLKLSPKAPDAERTRTAIKELRSKQ
jgi:Flp pilus assembly protein TadD